MDVSNAKLIEVFDMINERLYGIEKSQNIMMTHLKNKCIQERKLDKDLFQIPIDVHTFYDETYIIEKHTLLYVSTEFVNMSQDRSFSIYKQKNFNIVKSFLPQILDNDKILKLEQHVNNGTKDIITCNEFNIVSMFDDIDHHILNAFVTSHCRNVKWFFPCFPYSFVLQDTSSMGEAIKCIEDVNTLFNVSLSDVFIWGHHLKITCCAWMENIHREILIDVPLGLFDIALMSKELGFIKSDVESFIRRLETKLALKCYEITGTCNDEETTACGLVMLRDALKGMTETTN